MFRRCLTLPLSLAFAAAAFFPPSITALAAELVVDNSDAGVQKRGNWTVTSTTAGFFGSDYLFRTPGDGQSTVTWPVPGNAAAGRYEVFARWTSGPNRATNATYWVNSDSGATSIPVNQKTNGGTWQSLGTFDFQPGKSEGVTLNDSADGVVVADAIRFTGPQSAAAPAAPAAPPAPPQQQAAAAQPASAPVPNDARFFQQTGYRIGEDAFWDYFRARGGVRTFGYPVSNVFLLFGMKVQIFQRQIVQLRPDGGVQTMNVLDEGILPYAHMNGSTLPAPDPSVIGQSPKPDAPTYHEQTLEFVRAIAPDTWDGEPVNFAKTFFSSVRASEAFPNGLPDGGEALLPYFNLEIWGLPTSRPARDPSNPNFIYQRFQRGVMHYDKGCGCTQGLLLADYVKAVLTGSNLPPDLADEAKRSKLLQQYKPGAPQWLSRPGDLPGSDLTNGFRRDPTITLDAGHGGTEIGASHQFADGTVMLEKDLNLRVMLRVRDLLQQAGYQTVTTRVLDAQVNVDKKDVNGDGKVTLSDDLQSRVDIANNNSSDLLVSVHFNGISDPNIKGTYIFFDPDRPYSVRNTALALLVDQSITKALKDAGYSTIDHGATKDTAVLGGEHYYLLSPKTDAVARPSQMPAIIGEALFLTNEDDATALRKDAVIEAIARGYVEGIKAYVAKYPLS